MRLYYTANSPYSRVVRAAARQSGLMSRIEEIEAQTRQENSPHFTVTPLARVPVLVDGDITVADTRDICGYFDDLTGQGKWLPPEDHAARYLRHIVTGFLDGVAVWLRENGRPDGQRSDAVMRYEEHRAEQVLAWLEPRWATANPGGYVALCLACAVDIAEMRGMGRDWARRAPGVLAWVETVAAQPEMAACAPLVQPTP